MKALFVLGVFMLTELAAVTTHASLRPSVDFFYPHDSPYPLFVSPATDVLPAGFITITVDNEMYYYCDGLFYQKIMRDQKYAVVPPPAGAVVFNVPHDSRYVFIRGLPYYVYKGVYYKRTLEGYRVIYPPIE